MSLVRPVAATLLALAAGGPGASPTQWALDNDGTVTGYADADVDAPEAWTQSTGTGVVVAVLDTGVDATHPQLAGSIYVNAAEAAGMPGVDDDLNGYIDDVNGWDFACDAPLATDGTAACHGPNPNGTQIAGLIAAADDGALTHGLAPDVTILPLKIFHLDPAQNVANIQTWAADAIQYAIDQGAQVLQMGWSLDPAVIGGFPQPIYDALADAQAAGLVLVAAAGDEGRDLDVDPVYPAAFDLPDLITVAASTPFDEPADLPGVNATNFGAGTVDLIAPGENLAAIEEADHQAVVPFGGSGAAAAWVSATAALALSIDGSLTPAAVRQLILDNVDPVDGATGRVTSGGRLNAAGVTAGAAGGGAPPDVQVRFAPDAIAGETALYDAGQTTDADDDLAEVVWTFGDGTQRTGIATVHAFAGAGVWPVVAEASDDAGHRRLHRGLVRVPFRWHEQTLALDAVDCPDIGGGERDCAWTLQAPAGATWIRAHFEQLAVGEPDRSWAFFDGAGSGQFALQALPADGWTAPLRGAVAYAAFRGQVGGALGARVDRIAFALPGESNHPPVAQAGGSRAVRVGATAELDASDSSDPDGDPLSFDWQLLAQPETSTSTLAASGNVAQITPDVPGTYTLELSVSDGELTDATLVYVVTLKDDTGGCGCEVRGEATASPWAGFLAAIAVLFLVGRFRSRNRVGYEQ